jgi:hypothetical protein
MDLTRFAIAGALTVCVLTGCQRSEEQTAKEDDYAARIAGNGQPQSQSTAASGAPLYPVGTPTPATKSPEADKPQQVPAVLLNPQLAAQCGATALISFMNQPDTVENRNAIEAAAHPPGGMRVLRPGESAGTSSNPRRLNVMVDRIGVMRDFQCG